jgi:outer membrane protein insertion porin family
MGVGHAASFGFLLVLLLPSLSAQASAANSSELRSNTRQTEASTATTAPPTASEPPERTNQASDAFARYSGYRIRNVSFQNAQRADQNELLELLPTQAGTLLDRNVVRSSIQQLYASGRFRTISAEVTPYPDRSLDLIYVVDEKLFIGSIVVYGAPRPPTANQLVNASKLQLGQDFDEDAVAAGIERIKRLLVEAGYFAPTIRMDSELDPQQQRIKLSFIVEKGSHARLGQVIVKGDPGYPPGKIRSITKLHPGQPVTAARLSRAFTRLRKKYQKANRLEAQVSVVDRNYHTDTNRLDYVFDINRGPIVDVRLEGARLRRGLIKKYVPIYEEGAVDEDLLAEARRNLRDYFQTKGYFDAKITSRLTQKDGTQLVIFYVDRGQVHTFSSLVINGNKYFPVESIRERMALQPADILQRHGIFSSALLTRDLAVITGLYQVNGFQQVKVTSKTTDNYKGKSGRLRVDIDIDEGRQTLVRSVQVTGNLHFSNDVLLEQLNTIQGQPFSSYLLANDRDSVVSYYYDRGFPDVRVETTNQPSAADPNRQDIIFKVSEGRQVFVDKILLSGLHYTRPFVVNREFEIKEGDPLSQSQVLNTQRKLYGLSIFNQVDMASANPEGNVSKKDLMVQLEEAKRYTFDYGLGFQVQTGNVNSDCEKLQANPTSTQVCNPGGATGFSPLVTFGVTRANLRGRDDTIVFRTNLGRLQQRALLSYQQPHWLNRENLTLTFTAFYDSTQNVLTFSSQRLEGSVEALQQWRRGETFLYKFTYRRVKVDQSTLQISPNLIPLLSRPVRVGIPSFSYVRDHRDDPLDSHRGTLNAFDVGVASRYFGSQTNYSRFYFENSSYFTFAENKNINGRRWTFARSTRIGVENPIGTVQVPDPTSATAPNVTVPAFVPLPERFFTGGGNSHRGFAINQAGPRDPQTGFPLGGNGLFINNLELRTPPIALPYIGENLSAVLFHDAGNAFASASDIFPSLKNWTQPHQETCLPQSTQACDFNYISQAVGLGVRYRTPIGPVRVDVGYNLNPTVFPVRDDPMRAPYLDHTSHLNFYFSIGQTF